MDKISCIDDRTFVEGCEGIKMSLIGIECSHGFGDCMICMSLIEALCKKENKKCVISTRNPDAFLNAPFVEKVIKNDSYPNGESVIRSSYDITNFYQVTPYGYFGDFRRQNGGLSLLECPIEIGKKFDVEFDNNPKIYLTEEELNVKLENKKRKNIIIEAEHRSGQSWSIFEDFYDIIKNNQDCQFYWACLKQPHYKFDNLENISAKYTRRECISLIRHADLFISVGSGIFCGMLGAWIKNVKTLMLWRDLAFTYKMVIREKNMIKDVLWFDDRGSWKEYVNNNKI